jgi:signal peptidase I
VDRVRSPDDDDDLDGRASSRPSSLITPARPDDDGDTRPATNEGGDDADIADIADRRPEPSTVGFDSVPPTGARRARRRRSSTRNAIEWVMVLVGAVVVALTVKAVLFQAFYIPTGSMEPALEVNDRVLVNKFSLEIDEIARGDIIVFERPENASPAQVPDLIKRVIGLPGETVESRDGAVYVNGEALSEDYLTLPAECTATPAFAAQDVGPDELFVLGDNRCNSTASNVFGPVDFDLVVGRAFVRVWPLPSMSGL